MNREAIAGAHKNAEINNIENCDFTAGDVRKILTEIIESGRSFESIVIDPPRAGIGRKIVKKIVTISPRKIVYVSCNPATLAGDIAEFAGQGYRVDSVIPVDMFPHTFHIESVTRLTSVMIVMAPAERSIRRRPRSTSPGRPSCCSSVTGMVFPSSFPAPPHRNVRGPWLPPTGGPTRPARTGPADGPRPPAYLRCAGIDG